MLEKTLDLGVKEAILILDNSQRKYVSKIDIDEGFIVISKGKVSYFADARYYTMLKSLLEGTEIFPCLYKDINDLKLYILKNKIKYLGIDYKKTSVELYNRYKKELKVKLYDASKEIEQLRSVKSEEEISLIKKSCSIIERALKNLIPHIKEGITELEIKDFIKKEIVSLGGEGESFDTIVAFNENSAIPHHKTDNTKLKNNSVILIDTGAMYKGYASDISRMYFFGNKEDISQNFLDDYKDVLNANLIAESKISVGCMTFEADGFARDYLKLNGKDRLFTHSLGHGVGLDIHEYPYLSSRSGGILKENMVFTIEPGIYREYEYGIRIEDTVLLRQSGIERLFTDSKDLCIIENKKD